MMLLDRVACLVFLVPLFLVVKEIRKFSYRSVTKLAVHGRISPGVRRKLCECSYYSGYYIFVMMVGTTLAVKMGTFADQWSNYVLFPFPWYFRLYYLWELSFYIHSLYFIICIDAKRADFKVMVAHHMLTIYLLLSSYLVGNERIGLLVLITHNIADVFLYSVKINHYLKRPTTKIVLFGVFGLVFFLSRLVYFPLYVIRSSLITSYYITGGIHMCMSQNLALISLFFMHIYWFILIVRVVLKAMKEKAVGGDIRSDSDEEGEDQGEKQKMLGERAENLRLRKIS